MNKASIIEEIHKKLGGTRSEAEAVMDLILNLIVNTLKNGDEVSIAGLGIFSTKVRVARKARNPRTGEIVAVPEMKIPKFRPAKSLKEAVK